MKTIQIADINVVEQIRKSMGVVTSNNKGLALANTSLLFREAMINDCNITTQGLYTCSSSRTANLPNDTGSFSLMSLIGYSTDAYILQYLYGLNSGSLWFRAKVDSYWRPWKKISFTSI